jgi:hypothetical protein
MAGPLELQKITGAVQGWAVDFNASSMGQAGYFFLRRN